METVELDQKKALLVDFAEGKPAGSTLGKIESSTSETVSILRSIQKGGFLQPTDVGVPSPSPRLADPAATPTPKPIVIEKATIKDTKDDRTRDKKIVEKVVKPVVENVATAQEVGQKVEQKASQAVAQKAEPAKPKEDLSETRKKEGFFKGIRESITSSFKRQKSENEKRDSLLSKAFSDQDDAKEAGMLGLLGPIAPAIQETVGLVKGQDKDDGESRFGKLFSRSKKKETETAEENLKKVSEQGDRDEKGRFVAKAKPDYSKVAGKGIPFMQPKTKVGSEVAEKLDVIHDDLLFNEKEQGKRDKKLTRAVKQIETEDDDLSVQGILKTPSKLLKGGLAVAAVAAVSGGVTMIGKDIYDMLQSFTEKDAAGRRKGLANIKEEDIAGVAGGLGAGAIGATIGTLILPGLGTAIGAGLGMIIGNIMGEKIASMKVKDYGGPYGVRPQDKAELGTGPYGIKARDKDPIVSPAMGLRAAEKDANKQLGSYTGMYRSQAKVTEDRTSKRVTDGNQNKKAQKQIDISNEKLLSETQKTNKLLADMSKDLKNNSQVSVRTEQIPDGIQNTDDLISIGGHDR